MTEEREVTMVVAEGGDRLDRVLADRLPDTSRAQVQRLIKSGGATVNGRPSRPAYQVEPGDLISVVMPEELEQSVEPEAIRLDIIYEDPHLLAINKPAGMVVHPSYGHTGGTLVNALLAYAPEVADVGGLERAGIVHRLDKDTSGVLLVAKDEPTRVALQRQFKRRQIVKSYLALVEDRVEPREGVIEVPVGRDKRDRKKMAAVRGGRPARTLYRVVEYFSEYTLLDVRPHTGRTHQVRVHLAWMGFPVVGDTVYGRRRQRLLQDRHFLHAAQITFEHPVSGETMTLEAPLPADLTGVLNRLRRSR